MPRPLQRPSRLPHHTDLALTRVGIHIMRREYMYMPSADGQHQLTDTQQPHPSSEQADMAQQAGTAVIPFTSTPRARYTDLQPSG